VPTSSTQRKFRRVATKSRSKAELFTDAKT